MPSRWNPRRKHLRKAFTKSSQNYSHLINQSEHDKATESESESQSEAQWQLRRSQDHSFSGEGSCAGEGDVHDCKNGYLDSHATDIEDDVLSHTRHMSSECQVGPEARIEEERCMSGSSDSSNHDHSCDCDQDTCTQGVETEGTTIHDNYKNHSLTASWNECPHDQEESCSSEGKGKAIDPATLVDAHTHHLT
ncbi:hypothetical protein V865_007241 [Kwoniella europaea PYCC6329]|uniref:Uncharacterized protein n=1 Tax=Kwoniella europaea PYCC6329 TaxID=1423913 RepID=A0AAX4KST7_9TREE